MMGRCKRCDKRDELKGGLCEDCIEEEEAKRVPLYQKREKLSKEEIEKQIQEKRRDKKFWMNY
jgi:tRNA(Ile)-lysidine synthase TilS/MesJ